MSADTRSLPSRGIALVYLPAAPPRDGAGGPVNGVGASEDLPEDPQLFAGRVAVP